MNLHPDIKSFNTGHRAAAIIFLRAPVPGRAKTRLAAGVGAVAAAEFYRCCAERIVSQALLLIDSDVYIFYSDKEEADAIKDWLRQLDPGHFHLMPQLQVPDLGDRLEAAFQYIFKKGYSKAFVIGTDIPSLDSVIMQKSLESLDAFDAVWGPSRDGGYYLLAVKKLPPGLFDSINWSTTSVLEESLRNAKRLSLSIAPVTQLPRLTDVDTRRDLEEWLDEQLQLQTEHELLSIAKQTLNI